MLKLNVETGQQITGDEIQVPDDSRDNVHSYPNSRHHYIGHLKQGNAMHGYKNVWQIRGGRCAYCEIVKSLLLFLFAKRFYVYSTSNKCLNLTFIIRNFQCRFKRVYIVEYIMLSTVVNKYHQNILALLIDKFFYGFLRPNPFLSGFFFHRRFNIPH